MRRPHLTFSDGQPDFEKYDSETEIDERIQEDAFDRQRDEETKPCQHENKTFDWNIGAFVCDDCGKVL